jgi:hypothetical protein
MSLPEVIFVGAVVAAFSAYGLILFATWLTVEVLGEPRREEPAPAVTAAKPPLRNAA